MALTALDRIETDLLLFASLRMCLSSEHYLLPCIRNIRDPVLFFFPSMRIRYLNSIFLIEPMPKRNLREHMPSMEPKLHLNDTIMTRTIYINEEIAKLTKYSFEKNVKKVNISEIYVSLRRLESQHQHQKNSCKL